MELHILKGNKREIRNNLDSTTLSQATFVPSAACVVQNHMPSYCEKLGGKQN